MNLVAEPCPDVVWRFNGTMLGPSNDTFNYNNPCTEAGGISPNWTFTLDVALTGATSGHYSANFTNTAGMVTLPAYFTIPSGKFSMYTRIIDLLLYVPLIFLLSQLLIIVIMVPACT